MITCFPRNISSKGVALYLISLFIVSVLFFQYAIPWYFMVMGFSVRNEVYKTVAVASFPKTI